MRGLIECSYICHSLPTLGQSMQVISGGFGGFNRVSTHNLTNLKWNQGVRFFGKCAERRYLICFLLSSYSICPTRQFFTSMNHGNRQRYPKHFGSHVTWIYLHVFLFSRLFNAYLREATIIIIISFSLIFFSIELTPPNIAWQL